MFTATLWNTVESKINLFEYLENYSNKLIGPIFRLTIENEGGQMGV